MRGVVTAFDDHKGYGTVTTDDGRDVFFHCTRIADGTRAIDVGQRVAFTVGDNKDTVVETGLYNLTKDEAPVLIHKGKDATEQWLLVRLKNPNPEQS